MSAPSRDRSEGIMMSTGMEERHIYWVEFICLENSLISFYKKSTETSNPYKTSDYTRAEARGKRIWTFWGWCCWERFLPSWIEQHMLLEIHHVCVSEGKPLQSLRVCCRTFLKLCPLKPGKLLVWAQESLEQDKVLCSGLQRCPSLFPDIPGFKVVCVVSWSIVTAL